MGVAVGPPGWGFLRPTALLTSATVKFSSHRCEERHRVSVKTLIYSSCFISDVLKYLHFGEMLPLQFSVQSIH